MESEIWAQISQGRTPLVFISGSLVGGKFKRNTAKEQRVGQGRQTKGTSFVWVVTVIGKQNRGLIEKGGS